MTTPAPTPDEIKTYVALLWELAEGRAAPSDMATLRRIAHALERQQDEIKRLRTGKVAA